MKTLFSVLILSLTSFFVAAQETEFNNTTTDPENTASGTGADNSSASGYKYFISTNSGLQHTPVGFRIGVLDKMGGYIGTRFGKGYKYEDDALGGLEETEATLFSASAGFIFPIAIQNSFKVHTFLGIGYGKWFDRPSKSGQTMGIEFEGGLMLSYEKFLLNLGGTVLTGDGNSPKGDLTLGIGFRF